MFYEFCYSGVTYFDADEFYTCFLSSLHEELGNSQVDMQTDKHYETLVKKFREYYDIMAKFKKRKNRFHGMRKESIFGSSFLQF